MQNFGFRSGDDRSGGWKNGSYFWNQHVEGYASIYIYTGFRDFGNPR